jgi:hypothetical protein
LQLARQEPVQPPSSRLPITALLVAGALLALALLAQTVVTYRYVSNNLILQEARRTAEARVRDLERAVRLAQPQDDDALQALVADLQLEMAGEVAAIALLHNDGTIVAASGEVDAALAGFAGHTPTPRYEPLKVALSSTREVLIGVFPCRCGLRRDGNEPSGRQAGRLLAKIAIYPGALSAPFGRLRRNAAISASAALALLISLAIIAVRLGPYVRGQQLEAQMALARQVQHDLLPSPVAGVESVDAAAACVQAWQVGGDFYDIVSLPDGRISFVLGDVSGHGISAALLMGVIYGVMNAPPWGSSDESVDRAAAQLNQLLLKKSSGSRFASLFWCAYSPASRVLQYLNAGHPPPLLLRPSEGGVPAIQRLADAGPVLGLIENASYRSTTVTVQEGDTLVVFSDGIVETTNRRNEYFGEERLIAIVQRHRDRPARAISDEVLSSVKAFAGRQPIADDQTLLVVKM